MGLQTKVGGFKSVPMIILPTKAVAMGGVGVAEKKLHEIKQDKPAENTYVIGIAIIIAALLISGGIYMALSAQAAPANANAAAGNNNLAGAQGNLPTDAQLKAKVEKFLDENLITKGSGVTTQVTKIEPFDSYISVASVNVKNGSQVLQTATVYVSRDGSTVLLGQAFKTSETVPQAQATPPVQEAQPPAQVSKSGKPNATAYIMSFCPYGLQFLKAYIPVMEQLGDKADLKVGFVSYAMHGFKEIEGNSYIYCVQRDNKPKLTAYLRCFVEAGDYKGCLATAGVDTAQTESCVAALDTQYNITKLFNDKSTWLSGYYPKYPVEAADNLKYDVGGSPTFVLNGAQADVYPRSAENVKKALCASFTYAPAECNATLSTTNEAPGVGRIGTASAAAATAAECG
jgi:hypothetical protein